MSWIYSRSAFFVIFIALYAWLISDFVQGYLSRMAHPNLRRAVLSKGWDYAETFAVAGHIKFQQCVCNRLSCNW